MKKRKKSYLSLKPLIPYFQMQHPLVFENLFGRKAPLEVEIGFGTGEYLLRTAKDRPAHDFLGIDNSWSSMRMALRKLACENVTNVRLVLADARVALERLIKPQALSRVYSLFPCPWPKKRHVKYRLFSSWFLRLLNSRLESGGGVRLVTDSQKYLDWILEEVQGCGFSCAWENILPRFDTKYERKWQNYGQRIFFELTLQKEKHVHIPVKEDFPLKTYYLKAVHIPNLSPKDEKGKVTIVFKDVLYDLQCGKAMVEVICAEENLNQHFWIMIVRLRERWQIQVSEASSVWPTEGVQRALDLVYEACKQTIQNES